MDPPVYARALPSAMVGCWRTKYSARAGFVRSLRALSDGARRSAGPRAVAALTSMLAAAGSVCEASDSHARPSLCSATDSGGPAGSGGPGGGTSAIGGSAKSPGGNAEVDDLAEAAVAGREEDVGRVYSALVGREKAKAVEGRECAAVEGREGALEATEGATDGIHAAVPFDILGGAGTGTKPPCMSAPIACSWSDLERPGMAGRRWGPGPAA